MRNLIRFVLLSFLAGVVYGVVINERGHRRQHDEQVRAFQNDPELIALNKEWEREDRSRRWLKDAEESEGDDES
jgi:hypothetical protein